jgi:hypothetical protein
MHVRTKGVCCGMSVAGKLDTWVDAVLGQISSQHSRTCDSIKAQVLGHLGHRAGATSAESFGDLVREVIAQHGNAVPACCRVGMDDCVVLTGLGAPLHNIVFDCANTVHRSSPSLHTVTQTLFVCGNIIISIRNKDKNKTRGFSTSNDCKEARMLLAHSLSLRDPNTVQDTLYCCQQLLSRPPQLRDLVPPCLGESLQLFSFLNM